MAGRGETPGPARYPALRLQECQHGCGTHLGDIVSIFFRFISGNLARGAFSPEASGGGSLVVVQASPGTEHRLQGALARQ
ncbi:hypothetical protein MJG53_004775 [Ovis ammon polii x Ovis aries]|uniref:Uncharacterized protein n=1 Tax=Ovis ammon polii x Ovis aries TaxID=2918886 RepID=A0ACB9VBI4_9CETA|nr:hypothetical protein MJG53_004775 [Ovis ammon polii x Ovis aries]